MRHGARLRRIGNERALRRGHLREAGRGGAQALSAKGIVPAGIEDHDVEQRACALHLLQHQVGIDHLVVEVGHALGVRARGNEPIGTLHLNPVPGIVKERDIGTADRAPEAAQRLLEARAVKVDLRPVADELEAERSQRIGNQPRVVCGIAERGYVLVAAVADDECDALLRAGRNVAERTHCRARFLCRRGKRKCDQHKRETNGPPHGPTPKL